MSGFSNVEYMVPNPTQATVTEGMIRWGTLSGALFGCLLIVVGSLMEWVKVTTIFGNLSVAGTDSDGMWFIAAALVLAGSSVTVAFYRNTYARAAVMALGIFAVAGAIGETVYVSSKLGEAEAQADGMAAVSLGTGLYVLVIGAMVVLASTFLYALKGEPQG